MVVRCLIACSRKEGKVPAVVWSSVSESAQSFSSTRCAKSKKLMDTIELSFDVVQRQSFVQGADQFAVNGHIAQGCVPGVVVGDG